MKGKLAFMFIILGGVAGAFGWLDFIPFIVSSTVGAAVFSLSYMIFNSVYSGVIWGVKIKSKPQTKFFGFLSVVGLAVGGFSLIRLIIGALAAIASSRFVEWIINAVLFVAVFLAFIFIAKKLIEKDTSKGTNALVLGNLPLFDEIDKNIGDAAYFVVSFEGVALFSSTNYCYAVYLYEDYQLGSLTTVSEVALAGMYFCQKYGDRYTFKIDSEVIPGEPGQTAVAVGMGGIAVARTSGTPAQYIFKSYIFTRK